MSKNFIVSYVTDVDTGLKLKEYAKKAGLSLSSFSALATRVLISALPFEFFQEAKPAHLESVLKDIITSGYDRGGMGYAV